MGITCARPRSTPGIRWAFLGSPPACGMRRRRIRSRSSRARASSCGKTGTSTRTLCEFIQKKEEVENPGKENLRKLNSGKSFENLFEDFVVFEKLRLKF